MKTEFFRQDSKLTHMQNLMKIGTVRAELFRTDGETGRHTDMMKLIVAFRNFANAANNVAKCNGSTWKVRHLENGAYRRTEFQT
jgi:hypothetical protein